MTLKVSYNFLGELRVPLRVSHHQLTPSTTAIGQLTPLTAAIGRLVTPWNSAPNFHLKMAVE